MEYLNDAVTDFLGHWGSAETSCKHNTYTVRTQTIMLNLWPFAFLNHTDGE